MLKRQMVLLAALVLGLVAADDKNDPAAPPPLELQVEVNGKPVTAQADKPFEVDVAGQKVQIKVTTLPYRVFDREGIRFRYPAHHAWEYDKGDASYMMWTLDGNSNVLTPTKYKVDAPLDTVSKMLVSELTQQYGGPRNVKVAPATLRLGEMEVTGNRLDVTLVNQHLRQELYVFQAAGAVFSLVIQDSPEKGKATPETQEAVELLQKSFEVTAK